MDWPTTKHPGRALIGATDYGTFGIVWRHFPAMENRGGYSGPYDTIEEAEQSARAWAEHWEVPISIEHVESLRNSVKR